MITSGKAREPEKGMIVMFQSVLTNFVCGKPFRVTKVSGDRIYIIDPRDDDHITPERFRSAKSIVFLCDGIDEANRLYDAARTNANQRIEMVRRLNAEMDAEWEHTKAIIGVQP